MCIHLISIAMYHKQHRREKISIIQSHNRSLCGDIWKPNTYRYYVLWSQNHHIILRCTEKSVYIRYSQRSYNQDMSVYNLWYSFVDEGQPCIWRTAWYNACHDIFKIFHTLEVVCTLLYCICTNTITCTCVSVQHDV